MYLCIYEFVWILGVLQYGSVPTNYTKYYVPAKVNNNPRYAFLTTMDKRGLANLTTMKELNYAIFGLSYFER